MCVSVSVCVFAHVCMHAAKHTRALYTIGGTIIRNQLPEVLTPKSFFKRLSEGQGPSRVPKSVYLGAHRRFSEQKSKPVIHQLEPEARQYLQLSVRF